MKARKIRLLERARRAGLFDLARRRSARAIRILCYHGIWLGRDGFTGDAMFMRPAAFAKRMRLLRHWGYPVISLDDAIDCLTTGRAPPPNAVVITIDDGWYGTFAHMLPVLKQHELPATLYCDTANLLSGDAIPHVMARYLRSIAELQSRPTTAAKDELETSYRRATDVTAPRAERRADAERFATLVGIELGPYVADRAFHYMTPSELRRAHRDGLSIELHTHNHTIHDMSRTAIAEEIRLNRETLSEILSKPPHDFRHFCYPSGRASAEAASHCSGIGLASTTTTVQGLAWPGTPLHLLPRLLDNENHTEIEFEAELSGFADILRSGRRSIGALADRFGSGNKGREAQDAA
ncbi:MAG TPA: polysaccharide deacetylase family protein [Hyphomicrobiaceae bacterium]|nr:polysaccharide deacetylase family protein [Hyphomicrobiaceae bacterium]